MTSEIASLRTGTFKLSPIEFDYAMSDAREPSIKLGFIGEFWSLGLHGLGLIARTSLTPFEIDLTGKLGSQLLDDPYEYLASEFDEAWDNGEPGHAIEFLSAKHCHSLRVALPVEKPLPHNLLPEGLPVRSLMLGYLIGKLEDAAYDLLPLKDDSRQDTGLIFESLKKAA